MGQGYLFFKPTDALGMGKVIDAQVGLNNVATLRAVAMISLCPLWLILSGYFSSNICVLTN